MKHKSRIVAARKLLQQSMFVPQNNSPAVERRVTVRKPNGNIQSIDKCKVACNAEGTSTLI